MQNEIAPSQIHTIVGRMPKVELSYEINSHKKDDMSYKIGLAIPMGKKYYAWVTYNEYGENVIYIMEINREHKISHIFWIPYEPFSNEGQFEMGTIFYGTMTEGSKDGEHFVYLIEDILYDRGISTKYFLFGRKMMAIQRFLHGFRSDLIFIGLPILWSRHEATTGRNQEMTKGGLEEMIPEKWSNKIGYQVHHIQYRCPDKIAPFINLFLNKPSINIEGNLITGPKHPKPEIREHAYPIYKCKFRADYHKPQYRMPAVFLVKADIDTDIYRLFAYGRNKTHEYYDIAYIASYESSIFMNRIFRHIKENENLDFIEESDDEEEFENIDPKRFVNLDKEVLIECIFHTKFKKWIPKRVVKGEKIVHIGQLCRIDI